MMTDTIKQDPKQRTLQKNPKSSYVFESQSYGVVDLGGFESLMILEGGGDPPDGYHKIPIDLNKGSGEDTPYLYLCYKLAAEAGKAITDLNIENTGRRGTPRQQNGYYYCRDQDNRVVDLNRGVGGDYIWSSYASKDPEQQDQQIITGIDVLAYPGGTRNIPKDWTLIDKDLNEGVGPGSWYIYLLYQEGVRAAGPRIEDST